MQIAQQRRPIWLALVALAAVFGYFGVQIVAAVVNHMVKTTATTTTNPPFTASTAHSLGSLAAIIAAVGMARAFWKRRQSTTAWATGARGERTVASRLASVESKGVLTVHDRRIPGSTANIDHVAVGPSGVFVIDSKVRKGSVTTRATGPIWNRGPTKLFIGSRDCTSFITGMDRQVAVVAKALGGQPDLAGIRIHPMITVVDGEWGLFARPLRVQGVWVGWPREMARAVSRQGPLSPEMVRRIASTVASHLPEA